MLKIINYELESKQDLTIVHISDIHYSKMFNLNKFDEIISEVKRLKPAYVCITGDIVDNIGITETKKMEKLTEFLNNLSKLSKLIIGLGNHDTREYKKMKDNKWYEKLDNAILLNNSYYEDNNICFYGLTINDNYYHHEKSNKDILLNEISKIRIDDKKYNILLFHSPMNLDSKEISSINNFDLILVGHTHNGLTPHIFPGNFGIVAPHHHLYMKNARNSFKSGKSRVIISGGITKLPSGTKIFHVLNKFYASDLNYICLKKR